MDIVLLALIRGSHLADQGRNRKMFNLMELAAPVPMIHFSFQYWQGPVGQDAQTVILSITRFQSEKLL